MSRRIEPQNRDEHQRREGTGAEDGQAEPPRLKPGRRFRHASAAAGHEKEPHDRGRSCPCPPRGETKEGRNMPQERPRKSEEAQDIASGLVEGKKTETR